MCIRDRPKTGDTTNLPLLYALAGLSAVGIAVCGVIGFKKKDVYKRQSEGWRDCFPS